MVAVLAVLALCTPARADQCEDAFYTSVWAQYLYLPGSANVSDQDIADCMENTLTYATTLSTFASQACFSCWNGSEFDADCMWDLLAGWQATVMDVWETAYCDCMDATYSCNPCEWTVPYDHDNMSIVCTAGRLVWDEDGFLETIWAWIALFDLDTCCDGWSTTYPCSYLVDLLIDERLARAWDEYVAATEKCYAEALVAYANCIDGECQVDSQCQAEVCANLEACLDAALDAFDQALEDIANLVCEFVQNDPGCCG